MTHRERREYLLTELLKEKPEIIRERYPNDLSGNRMLLRALMNIRRPAELSKDFIRVQNAYLKEEIRRKGITRFETLTPIRGSLYLWRGDITTLKCDAIVNAANLLLLGCFKPNHECIDNAVHTYAGLELRNYCAELMKRRGGVVNTGEAVLTPSFNLPCKYIIHTVGPWVQKGIMTDKLRKELANCYRACLKIADIKHFKSIAFCCISTGMYYFPNEEAAEIAVKTVEEYLKETGSKVEVVFNVFKKADYEIYKKILTGESGERKAENPSVENKF